MAASSFSFKLLVFSAFVALVFVTVRADVEANGADVESPLRIELDQLKSKIHTLGLFASVIFFLLQ